MGPWATGMGVGRELPPGQDLGALDALGVALVREIGIWAQRFGYLVVDQKEGVKEGVKRGGE